MALGTGVGVGVAVSFGVAFGVGKGDGAGVGVGVGTSTISGGVGVATRGVSPEAPLSFVSSGVLEGRGAHAEKTKMLTAIMSVNKFMRLDFLSWCGFRAQCFFLDEQNQVRKKGQGLKSCESPDLRRGSFFL